MKDDHDQWWENAKPSLKLSHCFRMANMQHRRVVEQNMPQLEVFPAQHRFLATIARKPKCSQKELAEIMQVSTATVAVSIKKLEKNGYIKRVVPEEDNRINQLEVTEKGMDMVKQGFKIFEMVDETMLEGFTAEEVEQFTEYLMRLYEKLLTM